MKIYYDDSDRLIQVRDYIPSEKKLLVIEVVDERFNFSYFVNNELIRTKNMVGGDVAGLWINIEKYNTIDVTRDANYILY